MDLKDAREIAGFTQPELADMVGVDVSFISLLEAGKRDINTVGYAIVVRIALALGVSPHQIGALPWRALKRRTLKPRKVVGA